MLPEFLLADNSQVNPDLVYVVHTTSPRFIVECDVDGFYSGQVVHWLDDKPESEELIDELIEKAENFFEAELENQDNLYDEDEE